MSQLKIPKSLDFSPRTALGKSPGHAASGRERSSPDSELARVVEPLVSYICAANRPRAALLSAMAVLRSEMEATNRAACAHYGPFLECC
ncbi:MAG: hypothetical protein MUF06_05340 [Pirellulaceae bacterium]|nr:hypothetical protein [Pirellulaceae bacterium]